MIRPQSEGRFMGAFAVIWNVVFFIGSTIAFVGNIHLTTWLCGTDNDAKAWLVWLIVFWALLFCIIGPLTILATSLVMCAVAWVLTKLEELQG